MTKKSRILHLQELIDKGACPDQVRLFRKRFGKSVSVTVALCVKVAQDFDLGWAASNLLSAPALAEYERVRAQALAEYERVRAQALAEYERVRAQAWAEYERVRAQAWAEYERVRAQAFAQAYINDQE
jgi:cell division septum initiation protein DivIVA